MLINVSFQFLRANRIASIVNLRGVKPPSYKTSAANSNVHRLRAFPYLPGVSCSIARNASRFSCSKISWIVFGREDFSFKHSNPSRLNVFIVLRTVPLNMLSSLLSLMLFPLAHSPLLFGSASSQMHLLISALPPVSCVASYLSLLHILVLPFLYIIIYLSP